MKILNTDCFEKLKIKPVDVNNLQTSAQLVKKLEKIVKKNPEWVDMGGSVLWKNINMGDWHGNERQYEYDWNYYDTLIDYESAIRYFGKKSLPTKKHFDELSRCKTIWGVFNTKYDDYYETRNVKRFGRYFYTNDLSGVLFFPADGSLVYNSNNSFELYGNYMTSNAKKIYGYTDNDGNDIMENGYQVFYFGKDFVNNDKCLSKDHCVSVRLIKHK